uniref:Predicted protein n=1 Tax=Hordeum vulgare subsp. vulgare TaxID=112509 RepID=F2D7K9_HORVV|nr:predicted protein [Hordeum vulgare subsp. vulgare]
MTTTPRWGQGYYAQLQLEVYRTAGLVPAKIRRHMTPNLCESLFLSLLLTHIGVWGKQKFDCFVETCFFIAF